MYVNIIECSYIKIYLKIKILVIYFYVRNRELYRYYKDKLIFRIFILLRYY